MMRKPIVLWVGVVAIIEVVVGCGRPASDAQYSVAHAKLAQNEASSPAMGSGGPMAGGSGASKQQAGEPPQATISELAQSQPDRYLIKNANVTVEVVDARKATEQLVQMVTASRGYVSNVRETVDGLGARSAILQVRVPFTGFDHSIDRIADLGKVLDKQVTAEDVTEEFVDTQAKLRNLKRTEARLLDHLARTGKLSETLLVEKELTRVRQEIEQLEGRVRFLSHRIAFSTIDVTLQETAKQQALVPPESYSPANEGSDAIRSLVAFGRSVLSMVIWAAVWAVVWVPAVACLWWLSKKGRLSRPRGWQPNEPQA